VKGKAVKSYFEQMDKSKLEGWSILADILLCHKNVSYVVLGNRVSLGINFVTSPTLKTYRLYSKSFEFYPDMYFLATESKENEKNAIEIALKLYIHKWYRHPKRHPKNVDGPFYSLAYYSEEEKCYHSECLDCDLPQGEAKGLLKNLYDKDGDTYFIKQPTSLEEVDKAISAIDVCCLCVLRYGGNNPDIIKRIAQDSCDYVITPSEEVRFK